MANEITGLNQPTLRQAKTQPSITPPPGERLDQGIAATSSTTASDKVTLTDQAQLLQKLEASIADQPAVDQGRIDKIKHQIASGQYSVNADRVAQQLTALEGEVSPAGGELQRETGVTRTKDGYSVTTNVTGPNGHRNRSATVTTSYDAATQTLSRDTTITGTNGQQITRHGEVSRTDDGLVRSITATGPDGNTVTVTATRPYDNPGVSRE